jgi:hypothetical protein
MSYVTYTDLSHRCEWNVSNNWEDTVTYLNISGVATLTASTLVRAEENAEQQRILRAFAVQLRNPLSTVRAGLQTKEEDVPTHADSFCDATVVAAKSIDVPIRSGLRRSHRHRHCVRHRRSTHPCRGDPTLPSQAAHGEQADGHARSTYSPAGPSARLYVASFKSVPTPTANRTATTGQVRNGSAWRTKAGADDEYERGAL